MDLIVAKARSGVTSDAMRTSPRTLMWSLSPAALTASRSSLLIVPQSDFECLTVDRFLDGIRLCGKLIADRRPDKVGAGGVEPFLNQEVDAPEVHMAEIDRDLLCFGCFFPELMNVVGHLLLHPSGWYMDGRGAGRKGRLALAR